MIKRTLITFALCFLSATIANAQKHKDEFARLFKEKDFTRQFTLLQAWEKATPNDPELYVAFFNHYFAKSRTETVSLTQAQPQGESVALRKEGDGKVAGYLGSNVTFNKSDFDAGLSYIDRGIAKFPDRLDMRFGKTYALGQITDFQRFAEEVINAIDRSDANKNVWIWRDGKPLERPKEFMLRSIQDYIVQLFNAGDGPEKFIRSIAEAVLKYYPEHVESLSNLAVYSLIKEDYDGALVPLLKAEKLAPADPIIIGNIAYSYYKKKDKTSSEKYYKKLSEIGDAKAKQAAGEKLGEITAWK